VLAGFPVWIADTAGLREAADAIEAEGVRRALARAEEADLRIAVVEANSGVPEQTRAALQTDDLLVHSKSDLVRRPPTEAGDSERRPVTPEVAGSLAVSVLTGDGLAELNDLLATHVAETLGREEAPVLTRARHRRLVEEARAALLRAIPALDQGPELAAEDVRVAADQIGRLTGRIDVEDLLGEIFSSFCVGK
jgi:tRNA modification GTPase